MFKRFLRRRGVAQLDFTRPRVVRGYIKREVDPCWVDFVGRFLPPRARVAVDLGCGTGVYTKAVQAALNSSILPPFLSPLNLL